MMVLIQQILSTIIMLEKEREFITQMVLFYLAAGLFLLEVVVAMSIMQAELVVEIFPQVAMVGLDGLHLVRYQLRHR